MEMLLRPNVGRFGFVFFGESAFLASPGLFLGFVWKNSVQSSVVSPQYSASRFERLLDRYRTKTGPFRNFAFWATSGSASVGHGDARIRQGIQSPRAARRPYRYITRRVIARAGESERSGA